MDDKLRAFAREGARVKLAMLEREMQEIGTLFPGIIKEQRRRRMLELLQGAREKRWAHKNAGKKA